MVAPPVPGVCVCVCGAILEGGLRCLRGGRAVRRQGAAAPSSARRLYAVCVAFPKMASRSSSLAVAGALAVAAERLEVKGGMRRAKGGSA